MKCPACGLYHPAFYERCVACGISFSESSDKDAWPASQDAETDAGHRGLNSSFTRMRFPEHLQADEKNYPAEIRDNAAKQSLSGRLEQIRSLSTKRGTFIALLIVFVFAGATAFFLSRSPDDQRLLAQGKSQLSLGQYAFAVQTLSKVSALKPNDPKVFLALARAYIGVDQLDEAWDCITHAQQLGAGVVSDPALATELANYYKQHGQYEKAIDLLRPLANASVPGKRAELADLDALWGDDCLERGKVDAAKRAWEEVLQLNEGARALEAKARLATIYLKLVDIAYSSEDDAKALDYLNKVNALDENARNYLLAADICERDGKLKEAIDQVQRALKLKTDDQFVKTRLAQLYMLEGKELIQLGKENDGYAYLQQINGLDPGFVFPAAVLKNLVLGVADGKAKIAGDLWNDSNKTISTLTIKVQLYDNAKDLSVWQKEQQLIDEFVVPIAPQQSKSFAFLAPLPHQKLEALSFKVFLDGNYYGAYSLKPGSRLKTKAIENPLPSIVEGDTDKKTVIEAHSKREIRDKEEKTGQNVSQHPKTANEPDEVSKQSKKSDSENEAKESVSPEEKTMKDLEF